MNKSTNINKENIHLSSQITEHKKKTTIYLFVCLMVFNATFNNIWVISWRSVLLMEETKVTDKLDHIMLYTPLWSRFELTTSVVIGTDCIDSCKSNNHTITTALIYLYQWIEDLYICNQYIHIYYISTSLYMYDGHTLL